MTREKTHRHCRVLIAGSGPAGLSASIYTARAGLEPVVITGMQLGGQASLTADIENYPGFEETISGMDLLAKFQAQAEKFGAVLEYESVLRMDLNGSPFEVETEENIFHAEKIILTTGSRHLLLNVPGEKELTGHGVSYCASCDGFLYRGKNVAVIGGGNSAVEEAVFLTRFASSVTIIHRRDSLRADKAVQDKAFSDPKIRFIWDSVVTAVEGEEKVTGLRLKNVKTNEESVFETDGVFIFVGTQTVTDLFEGQLEMEGNVVKVGPDMQTSVPGVYAAGETVDDRYRQIIVSAGSGAQAGISVTKACL